MTSTRIKFLEGKFEYYKECLLYCSESMRDFYYNEAKKYELLISDEKHELLMSSINK